MELSHSDEIDPTSELTKVVETMKNVTLSPDFWDEFRSEVGDTDDIHKNHELLKKLTRFQHHAEFKRTSKLVQSYKFDNPMISLDVHDQGPDSFTCWAYSAATMIGNSCRVMITELREKDLISEKTYKICMVWITSKFFHPETRNSIMMILLPRQLHVDDETQAAFLRAAVSRLANPSIIDREGIFYLRQVTCLFGFLEPGLNDFPVNVTYKTYYNSRHPEYQTGSKPLIDEAVAKHLCPVAAVNTSTFLDEASGHGTHAMVLVTIKDGEFIFKNTYVKNKQVTIPVENGPLEFYYVHMELNKNGLDKLEFDYTD